MKVSSDSTIAPPLPPIGGDSGPLRIASRIRCDMNQADFRVTPSMRCSWLLEMPFFEAHSSAIACSHIRIGIWLSSKMVPTFTVKGLRQSLHL